MIFADFIDIISFLTGNVLMLFAVVVTYSITNYEVKSKSLIHKYISGIVIGLVGVVLLLNPFLFREGIMFDSRTILLSLTAFYFSLETTIIAALITMGFRAFLGGSGVIFGIFIAITSVLSGYILKNIFNKHNIKNIFIKHLLVGIFANFAIMFLPLFVREAYGEYLVIIIIYLILFPIVTILLGFLIENQKSRLSYTRLESAHKDFLQTSIDNVKTLIILAVDKQSNYVTFNLFHKEQMYNYYDANIKVGDNLLKVLKNDLKTAEMFEKGITKALSGEIYNNEYKINKFGEQVFKNHYYPTYEGSKIVGVTIYTTNVTDIKLYEESIFRISYYDALTNVPNRRYYQEQIEKLNKSNEEVAIVICDINGLRIINDAYGHTAGDELLTIVAKELSSLTNTNNLFRIGGDEFIFLLKNYNETTTTNFIKSIEKLFENKKYKGINISVSYGIGYKIKPGEIESAILHSEADLNKNKVFEGLSHRSNYIKSILQTMEEKNLREKDHSIRVANICKKIGSHLKMSRSELNLLEAISSLHDIGKIAIDESILNKPGKLNEREWEIIKTHPEIGYRIISNAPEYALISEDILSHHERYDGTGYPRGLKGENIPIRARIIAIADAYDAMISDRPYRKAMTKAKALEEIRNGSGTQFDPKLVEIFLNIIE